MLNSTAQNELLKKNSGICRTLEEIAEAKDSSVGGKAYNLAVLKSLGFEVPEAVALQDLPEAEEDWQRLVSWWDSIGRVPLAARSSALGEDAKNASFAGQLTSVLDIRTEDDLRSALATCFMSKERMASRAYQDHFKRALAGMNVLVQRMVNPKFSGVFFSRDPRSGGDSWLVETVEGFGEKLVSGHETPFRFSPVKPAEKIPGGWQSTDLERVVEMGKKMVVSLGFEVDAEWAIDQDGKLWALQARPITTDANALDAQSVLRAEYDRLHATHPAATVWDAQTFVEWTGLPSHLSFSIWETAFSPKGAFSKALQHVGYEGYRDPALATQPLLEQIFGRACLNLNRLQPLFFGKVPYEMVTKPHPHLVFSWKKIDAPTILHAPSAISRMITVAWNLQHQDGLLEACKSELKAFTDGYRTLTAQELKGKNIAELKEEFKKLSFHFSTEALKWPFVLAIVAEGTMETLELVLSKDLGKENGPARLRSWMSSGIRSITREMERDLRTAGQDPEKQKAFMERFGHRGPGELDLASMRWEEVGEKAFTQSSAPEKESRPTLDISAEIAKDIHAIRRPLAEKEWKLLKELLELREEWKMAIMKPYRDLRRLALEIGERSELAEEIFLLTHEEIESLNDITKTHFQTLIQERSAKTEVFRKIAFPTAFALSQLESLIDGSQTTQSGDEFNGEPISPGLASGEIRVVRNPLEAMAASWPANTVLVAEATDPGWTPLFQRASAIIVARGGVLSHCAIVAREMGLPAISGIQNCTEIFKDGENVWVDGTTGRVTRAASH